MEWSNTTIICLLKPSSDVFTERSLIMRNYVRLVRWIPAVLLTGLLASCSNDSSPSQANGTGGGATNGTSGATNGGSAPTPTGVGGSSSSTSVGPGSCSAAQAPYQLSVVKLDGAIGPITSSDGWGAPRAALPVAVDPSNSKLYVGFTRQTANTLSANIVAEDGTLDSVITVPEAAGGSIAVTADGFGLMLFDPADESSRLWAGVARVSREGTVKYRTDLFRSANLEDAGTKGEPSTNRLVYTTDDQLIAYFEHSERIDGVRHFGGYLAAVDGNGVQKQLSDWFGSHNLDQRAIADGAQAVTLGLGDAYPKGIIFASVGVNDRPSTDVLYPLAANGVGTTNGQLGGIVDGGTSYLVPFITNRSLAQDFDAGAWPNTDEAKSQQIVAAAEHGTDLGLLTVPKGSSLPDGGLTATFLDVQRGVELGGDASLSNLKIARYGSGFYLLVWQESLGEGRNATSQLFTMVIDAAGAVCQPKTLLASQYRVLPGDDIVTRPDGRISWANDEGDQINVVTLTP